MALYYNGNFIAVVNYNGNDVRVLVKDGVGVFGKAYPLTLNQGANTTITVNRTSSPNQHASTGTLTSGSLIYHGDVLTITMTADSGYNLTTATIKMGGGTVTSPVTVSQTVVVTTVAESAGPQWHTVWSGSTYKGGNIKITASQSSNSSTYTFSDIVLTSGVPTRITGYVETLGGNIDFYGKSTQTYAQKLGTYYGDGFYVDSYLQGFTGTTLSVKHYITRDGGTGIKIANVKTYLEKVEQYY